MFLLDAKLDGTTTQKLFAKLQKERNELLTGFEYFVSNTDCYGFSTIAAAENCIRLLNDEKFNFWLKFFSKLMPEVDVLYNVIQSTNLTAKSWTTCEKFSRCC